MLSPLTELFHKYNSTDPGRLFANSILQRRLSCISGPKPSCLTLDVSGLLLMCLDSKLTSLSDQLLILGQYGKALPVRGITVTPHLESVPEESVGYLTHESEDGLQIGHATDKREWQMLVHERH